MPCISLWFGIWSSRTTSVLPNRLCTGLTWMPFTALRRAARSCTPSICTAATPLVRHLTMMRSVSDWSTA